MNGWLSCAEREYGAARTIKMGPIKPLCRKVDPANMPRRFLP